MLNPTRSLAFGLEISVMVVTNALLSLHWSGPGNGRSWLDVNPAETTMHGGKLEDSNLTCSLIESE